MKSIALGTESANKTPPPAPVNTLSQNSTRRALISFQKCAIQSMAAAAMALLVVTRNADESGPCSASINTSSAARRASAEASANTIDSLGPAGMPGSRGTTSARLAAMTHGLPGPSILSALGMVEVPKAAAATACEPPTLKMVSIPASRAATRGAASTRPSGPAGGRKYAVGTWATTAGTHSIITVLGNEPLPRGTYRATVSMGVIRSPANAPGRSSFIQYWTGFWAV